MDVNLAEVISNYGHYNIKVICSAEGYVDSDPVTTEYYRGAKFQIDGSIISIIDAISAVTAFSIIVDGEIITTVDYDGSEDWQVDLTQYGSLIPNGKRTVRLKAIGDGIDSDNLSNSVTYFAGVTPAYGVSGLYGETPTLTRTDEAVGLSFSIDTSTGSIASDFNDAFPWSQATIVQDSYDNEFLRMPTMYFRIGHDSSSRLTDIAVSEIPRPGDGEWYEVPSFDYGLWGGSVSGNKLYSKKGVSRAASISRPNFRTYAKALGDEYLQKDLYHATVMRFLWLIEFATKDSASVMTGVISGSYRATGGTSAVTTPSGYNTSTKQMRWHYIEDFVGNYLEFEDGVYAGRQSSASSKYYDYATSDSAKFADSTANYQKLSYPTPIINGELAAYGWDPDNPFLCMPTEGVSNNNYNTHFCDAAGISSSSYPCVCGGADAGNSYAYCGLFYSGRYSVTYASGNIGGRLLRIPAGGSGA